MGPFYAPITPPKWVRFARQSPSKHMATGSDIVVIYADVVTIPVPCRRMCVDPQVNSPNIFLKEKKNNGCPVQYKTNRFSDSR
ncbi:hypothetical protein Pan161_08900 [Gimesia algae]|uniref:Uncharacterized protein n=1 Tax=Gimesia algae TaxID=2527971 RepID=A0A517V8F6_9PLAN|nr:hypothetical protein Pan161_08900 [Gimesia algae]